jgi:two-component system, OmpR family, sensor kinase
VATRSITRRLIVILTGGILLFWLVAATGVIYVFAEELNETFDQALRETTQRLLPLAVDDLTERDGGPPRSLARSLLGSVEYLNYQIRDRSGAVLLETPELTEAPPKVYDEASPHGFRTTDGYRTYSETDEGSGLTLITAETTSHRAEAINDSIRPLFLPLLAWLPLSALVIWFAVRGALRPVHRLREQIAERGGSNLAPLDISEQPVELRPIAEATARLVDRLRAALDAERSFAANSAHELRTPIAGALAQTQRLIAKLGENPEVERARQIEQALKRLARLSEKLLQLSRVDAGLSAGELPSDLLPVLDVVVRDFKAELPNPERLHYQRGRIPMLNSTMDVDAFAIAMRNLIDNALKHGRVDGDVEVKVEDHAISVRNGGAVVNPEIIAGLRHRFARGTSEADGSGLGLSIVEAIAAQSGQRLDLSSPPAGQEEGFEARLTV